MNIGIFTDSYYPQISGVVTSTTILKNELDKLGHNVTIVTVAYPDIDVDNSDVIRLPSIPFLPWKEQRIGAIYSHKIMNKIKKLNLDIIHTQTEFSIGLFGRIVANRLGIPVIHTYHTMYEDYVHYISRGVMLKPASNFAKKASKLYCNGCNSVIVPSKKVRDILMNYGVNNEIEVIPTGIDLESFKKDNYDYNTIINMKKSLGIEKEQPVVLYIGRVAKEKSIDIIINSMFKLVKRIPDVKLLIVGDGPEKNNLDILAKSIGIDNSVIFTGEKNWNEIGKYYKMGDVFVSASKTETQGITFIEAMAAGIPVVAKYDRNLDGVIEDKVNGRIFNEQYELANILFDIIMNKDKAYKMSKKAYEYVENLSSVCFGKHVEAVYNKVIKKAYSMQRYS
ncbi:glycosyltransferase family 4 protein [Clostridium aestuarii]|uniref:Glycosyltransferase family 4 protein n=1 Tax=Clostridium aestuarii TaxID=338193 RepID=A0ABT4D178_9CLOT|nr:glycosyltransferase family 4 protein [Clostridium aestuarii]MCY6484070.1 glycosyltransferase family 4 protein [Clostridium aestuarii]